jgi:16S rRNA (guanine1207-N2)-methyltransferase
MSYFIVNEVVNGIPLSLVSHTSLFSKKKLDTGTRILLENLLIPEKGIVVDVGCGYGPIGIYIALKNNNLKIYMLDINPIAVKTAKYNVERYNLNNVIVMKSDVLENLPEKVNVIFSNPPLSKGVEFLEKLAKQSNEKLEDGYIQLVVYKGENNVIKIFGKYFSKVQIIKNQKGYSIILIQR